MESLKKLTIFIFVMILYFIKTEDISLWNNEHEITDNITQEEDIEKIDSYAFDDLTGAELYLVIKTDGNSSFILKEGSSYNSIPNSLEKLVKIKSPLIKLNSKYYVCSNESLIWINGNNVNETKRNDIANDIIDYKCLRERDKDNFKDNILVSFIGTPNVSIFDTLDDKWGKNLTIPSVKKIYAINNYTQGLDVNFYIAVGLDESDENSYLICLYKYDNQFDREQSVNIEKEKIELFLNENPRIELITRPHSNDRDFVTFLFSYVPNKNLYSLYNIILVSKIEFFEIKIFRFFNDFIIKEAGFILDTPYLYFSAESMINGQKYIGLLHVEYFLLIYNIEENINNILYYNYGKAFEDKAKLLYFSGNQQISFCPFIKSGDNCKNNIGDNKFIISLNETTHLYKNKIEGNCDNNKKYLDYYCIDNCPNGYTESQNPPGLCEYCRVDEINKRFFIGSKTCQHRDECKDSEMDSSTCYDCDKSKTDTIKYKFNCIHSCEQIHGEKNEDGSSCISCKDKSRENDQYYYSYEEKKCTKCENGIKNNDTHICIECKNNVYNNTLYFPELEECVNSCDKYYAVKVDDVRCEYCKNKTFYENGTCVSNCSSNKGYGLSEIEFKGKDIIKYEKLNICLICQNNTNSDKIFSKDGYCTSTCNPPYIAKFNPTICHNCREDNMYYLDNECVEQCPDYSQINEENKTCSFCERYYFDTDTKLCIENCRDNQTNKTGQYNISTYKYCENLKCDKDMLMIDGRCINCSGNYYNPSEGQCYRCFCGGKSENNEQYECNRKTGQCNCVEPFYGYNCEFLSEERKGNLKIISLNNRLIKTDKNFFTYEFMDNSTLPNKNYYLLWQLFFNDVEIARNKKYQKYFITETNEKVFGINKEVFEEVENIIIHIQLSIINNKTNEIEFYNKIKIILVNSFDIDTSIIKIQEPQLFKIEMNYILSIIKKEEKKYEGRYLFKYDLLDYNNETLPLTNYINPDSIDINLICSQRIHVNIKNDNNEIRRNEIFDLKDCNYQKFELNEILKDSYLSEKIFLLISFIKRNDLNEESYSKIKNFIKESIPKIINKNGYFTESNNQSINTKNITYSEPKNIFSLINVFATKIKEDFGKIDDFFGFFNDTFESVFKNNNISNETLSDSDIKSLFRTIDNIYDICIEYGLIFRDNSRFVEILDKLALYLSYKTYPSEIIRLVGKRLSFLSYHLGEHQTNISFQYINNSDNIDVKDFSKYSFDNYNLDEKICSQKNETLFCLTNENYTNLIEQLSEKYKNINDFTLNIYLFQELNKDNQEKVKIENIWDSDEFEKVLIKKNYSIISKLSKRENNFNGLEKDNDIILEFDIEFPFSANLSEKNEEKNDEDKNSIFSLEYFKKYAYDIPLSPDNSDYTCFPKSYYKNKTYYCFTHFDYKNKRARCRCKTKLNDEIIILKDKEIAKIFKEKQFEKPFFNLSNKYGRLLIYSFILFLLIPAIYFLIKEIIKDSIIINFNDNEIEEDETKENYKKVQKYYNTGIFRFSFYMALRRFPYFSVFNQYYSKYPKYINHLIICIGLLIGFICSLIPYYFIPFLERDVFINQRSIEYENFDIRFKVPTKYYVLSLIFCFFGILFGNLFVYFFSKIFNFEKEEINVWLKIKTICKDFIYYDIKSEVLLDSKWSKIQKRMFAYYYICGKYILRRKRRKKHLMNDYLNLISRNNQDKLSLRPTFTDIDQILPRTTTYSIFSSRDNDSIFTNSKKGNKKEIEMNGNYKDEPLLNNSDENDFIINNSIININKENTMRKKNKILLPKIDNDTIEICKLDNFSIDKNTNNIYNKLQKERFEKVRNKYIYVRKKIEIDDIEIDNDYSQGKNQLSISPEMNYSFYPSNSFLNLKKGDNSKESTKNIILFIFVSFILWIIFICLSIFILYLIQIILNKFDEFIIYAWLLTICLTITIINFILYYLKMIIGVFVLFHYYYLRKKNCLFRCLFWLFIDKAMVHTYKIRNLITKYKKEFDHL